jgi:hypothetical protein
MDKISSAFSGKQQRYLESSNLSSCFHFPILLKSKGGKCCRVLPSCRKFNVKNFVSAVIEFLTAVGTLSYGKTNQGGKLTPTAQNFPITLILKYFNTIIYYISNVLFRLHYIPVSLSIYRKVCFLSTSNNITLMHSNVTRSTFNNSFTMELKKTLC